MFNVSPALIGLPSPGEFDLYSNGLDGTTLAGQALSSDFDFAGGVLARLLLNTDGFLLLRVHTTASSFAGFAGAGPSGFLLASDGTQIGARIDGGRSASSDGTFSVGVTLPTQNVDIKGIHFDFALPSTGFAITGVELKLGAYDTSTVQFGTVAQLPEEIPPGFVALVWAALLMIGSFVSRSLKSHKRRPASAS